MILESIQRDEFARTAGLVTNDGKVSERGLADLLRAPLSRWGLSPRSDVLRHARDQLDVAGLREAASKLLPNVLGRLIRLGECAEVSIGHDRYIAPAPPRWIRTADGSGALLSVGTTPKGVVEHKTDRHPYDIVRRIQLQTDDELTALRGAGVRQISVEKWLTPLGYLEHYSRRVNQLVRSDEICLAKFWDLLVVEIGKHGMAMGHDAEVRAVVREPGGYFGRHNSDTCEGRWSDITPDGVWCAYRRGFGSKHWHPIVIEVDGGQRRAMDLYDIDEWRWALLARGQNTGAYERVERGNELIRVSFPAPSQFVTAMDILGPRHSSWSWDVSHGAPDPWIALK